MLLKLILFFTAGTLVGYVVEINYRSFKNKNKSALKFLGKYKQTILGEKNEKNFFASPFAFN